MHEVTLLGHKCADKRILTVDNLQLDGLQFANFIDVLRLCKKNVPFEWTNEFQNAFHFFKNKTNETNSITISRSFNSTS